MIDSNMYQFMSPNFNNYWNTNSWSGIGNSAGWNFPTISPWGGTLNQTDSIWSPSSSSSSSSTSSNTVASIRAERIRKKEEENAKIEARKELKEAQETINKNNETIAETEAQLKDFAEDSEGNFSKEKKLKDATFGEKLKTIGAGIFNGGMKLFEAFVPKKENGKVDWGKTALRVGGAALAFGATFIPVIGPFISAGLLTAGAVSGGVLVGKGIKKGIKCFKDENATLTDLKQTTEDITEGAVIVASSVAGIKSMRTSANVTGFKSATLELRKKDLSAISTMKSQGATTTQAIFGRFKGNLKNVIKSSSKKDEFDKKLQDEKTALNNKQNEIQAEINSRNNNSSSMTPDELLNAQRNNAFDEIKAATYKDLQQQLNNTGNKGAWENIQGEGSVINSLKIKLQQYKNDFTNGKVVDINGQQFKQGRDDEFFFSKIAELEGEFIKTPWYKNIPILKKWTNPNSQNNVGLRLNTLTKSKKAAMKDMALRNLIPGSGKPFQTELNAYTMGNNGRLSNVWTTIKPSGWFNWGKAVVWDLPMIPFNTTRSLCRSAAGCGYEWETALSPTYHDGFEVILGGIKQTVSKEEYEAAVTELNTQKAEIAKQQEEVTRQLNSLA